MRANMGVSALTDQRGIPNTPPHEFGYLHSLGVSEMFDTDDSFLERPTSKLRTSAQDRHEKTKRNTWSKWNRVL